MCGICGFVTPGKTYDMDTIVSMTELLVHRGPDQSGVYVNWIEPDRPGDIYDKGNVALGHRRLSIIDLSAFASQPMCNEDGTVWLVFNGEIYNFESLRSQLLDRGHKFRSRSDSEVIVHGYEEWGEGIFEKLNGMFAFAIWNSKRSRLFLVRDRIGIKPLYYFQKDNGSILFASELSALRAHPEFDAEIDRKSLYDYLLLSYVPTPWTIFEGVKKLEPGSYLIWEKGALRSGSYWERQRDDFAPAKNRAGLNDWIDRLEELLEDSVRLRLVSDVPLGAFLSGGIDSTIVVALMRKLSRGDVRTFSIGFEEDEFDESRYAERVASHLGTDHTAFRLSAGLTGELLERVIAHMDEPLGDPSAVPTFLVSKLARESGITVALSGDGGDELFCGYERYRKMEQLSRLFRIPYPVRKAITRALKLSGVNVSASLERILDCRKFSECFLYRMSAWKNGSEDISRMLSGVRGRSQMVFDEIFTSFSSRSYLDRMMLTDFNTYLVDDVLTKVDRMSMAVSLEVRVPILDHRVVEFSRILPLKYKFQGSTLKFIMKKLLSRYVPDELVDRPKMGFAIPVTRWLREDMRDELWSSLNRDRLDKEGLFLPDRVEEALKRFENGEVGMARFVWGLFVFEKWMEAKMGQSVNRVPSSSSVSVTQC